MSTHSAHAWHLALWLVVASCASQHVVASDGRALSKPPPDAIDPEAKNVAYPYPPSFLELNTQNQHLRMAYLDVVAKNPNGRSVLLLHGKNFTAAAWATTIAWLSDRGFRVIAPDQIGFGKSSKPLGYQYSFGQLAQNTRALLSS